MSPQGETVPTLLVANRGEIALRVIRTARRLGMTTVAVHTDLDVAAPHVRAADRAVRVADYLDVAAVVAAGREAGADLVHPGYGFLSERAAFARAVAEAGMTFVGPSPGAMDTMGRKDAAREVALAAGVPVVPSYDRATPADELALPVLVKAAAGGGGKGMRVVRTAAEYADALAAAGREAAGGFGDDTLLVEKYVERGRHVEVQVLADGHGHVVHLYERDCSAQRRHQKVLEEAPAPTVTAEQRRTMTDAAGALAREVGYTGAGTVEFLVDEDSGEPYFLEMNTRLQVEHPVTELAVTVRGEHPDLVAHQLAVARGEPLGFTQDDVALAGHAIEARVYAEDAYAGFLPQAGTATYVAWPGSAPGHGDEDASGAGHGVVRVDAALESGQEVSTAYDPMLGKVVAAGATREEARRRLLGALEETVVLGLTTNTGFLRELVATPEFRDATLDTAWLDQHPVPGADPVPARVLAGCAFRRSLPDRGPFRHDGWRLGGASAPVVLDLDRPVVLDGDRVRLAGEDGDEPELAVQTVAAQHDPGGGPRGGVHHLRLRLDGARAAGTVVLGERHVEVVHHGHRHVFTRPDVFLDAAEEASDGSVTAPMPGTVLDVAVVAEQRVAADELLGTLEAMKMELALRAPVAGTVARVAVAAGEQVALGAELFRVVPDEGAPDGLPGAAE